MMFLILLGSAAFLYYLYFKQRYSYWQRRGKLQLIELFELTACDLLSSIVMDEDWLEINKLTSNFRPGIKGPSAVPFAGTFFSENTGDGRCMEKHYLKNYGDVSQINPFEIHSQ